MSDYYPQESFDDLPLFEKKTREAPVLTSSQRERKHNKTKALRDLLSDGEWHDTHELVVAIGHRFSTNVDSLRQRGHVIEKRFQDSTDGFLYRLVGKIDVVKINEAWQSLYYASAHWTSKRKERLVFDGYRCCDCKSTDRLHVHHWRYDLFNEQLCDLMTLCEDCHRRLHSLDSISIAFPKSIQRSIFERLKNGS